MGVFKRIQELEAANTLLHQQIDMLKESMDNMRKKIDTLAKSTAGIPYGDSERVYIGMGITIPERTRKSLTETMQLILDHLKLEIQDTPAIEAESKLVKIKPIKPL